MNFEIYQKSICDTWNKIDSSNWTNIAHEVLAHLLSGSRVAIAGNGGSASTASHFVNDWVKGVSSIVNKPIDAICLVDNVSSLTAIANDLSFSEIFSFQVPRILRADDLLLLISGSGKSTNIIKAAEEARANGIKVVSITGISESILTALSDRHLIIPSTDMQVIEDVTISFGHFVLKLAKDSK